MASIQGPPKIALETALDLERKLLALNDAAWEAVEVSLDDDDQELVIIFDVAKGTAEDVVERILALGETVAVAEVPNRIPVRDDGDSWTVIVRESAFTLGEHQFQGEYLYGNSGGRRAPGPEPRPRYGSEAEKRLRHDSPWVQALRERRKP